MCPLANKKRIYVKDIIGRHLALRHLADKLFDNIDLLKDTAVIIDFHSVHTTSRSFMQQFLYRLKNSDSHITYINESENIRKMVDIVSSPKKKPVIVNPNSESVLNLDYLALNTSTTHNAEEGDLMSLQKREVYYLTPT
ncbi:hypothetical protein DRO03_09885 [Methanosarcinales archaeon]|nr:MAG: hypothetical protein DRO03_09885 [Methanosarcinales archaeon]